MTPREKAAYANRSANSQLEAEALESALKQLELSTSRAERALDEALAEVRAVLQAQPRRINDLNSRVIRLETVLELALNRPSGASSRLLDADFSATWDLTSS